MALTTHEKIRVESGFQSIFRESFLNSPDGSETSFFVNSDDIVKFVPNFGTGTTIAGISDVKVTLGLSGVYGTSTIGVSAIDPDQGSVELSIAPDAGVSLIIDYASSAITSDRIESVRKESESIINQRLSLCYDLPISPVPSVLTSMASRLSAALLLIRGYGAGSVDTARDGYALYDILMGDHQAIINRGTDSETAMVGEIGLICTANYNLVDDDGNIIPRNDDAIADITYDPGGRVTGRLYDVTEESFRFKDWQVDVDKDQPGSNLP